MRVRLGTRTAGEARDLADAWAAKADELDTAGRHREATTYRNASKDAARVADERE